MESDALCDFIWADPVDDDFGFLSGAKVKYNTARDCSIVFGSELVSQFLTMNNLQMIIRGHEVFLEGYKAHWDKHPSKSPPVLTIFSAPNYCRTTGNKSAILRIEVDIFEIRKILLRLNNTNRNYQ
jgi:diadenosine tetraphosphatase ApaH/serine/threonine PP2A family protein phosphatase